MAEEETASECSYRESESLEGADGVLSEGGDESEWTMDDARRHLAFLLHSFDEAKRLVDELAQHLIGATRRSDSTMVHGREWGGWEELICALHFTEITAASMRSYWRAARGRSESTYQLVGRERRSRTRRCLRRFAQEPWGAHFVQVLGRIEEWCRNVGEIRQQDADSGSEDARSSVFE